MPNAQVGTELEKQLLGFMKNSKEIHFNLDGMTKTLTPECLKSMIKFGEPGTRFGQNVTRWEFSQVWTHFRGKATFYFEGKPVDISQLLK